MGTILQKVFGLVQDENCSEADAIKQVSEDVQGIWRHHFGIRVIDGKEFDDEVVTENEAAEKQMIVRPWKIQEKILAALKEYKLVEYESRRIKKRQNFGTKEANLLELLDTPLDIMKVGVWRSMVVGGVKQKVWLPSGEEILKKSGILSWEEDLLHLRNQLSKEQPGCCDSFDLRQKKRDERSMKNAQGFETIKAKSDADIAKLEKKANISGKGSKIKK